jgi:hypothetical protein
MTRAATSEDYRLIFEDTMAGQLVMEDLMKRFAGVVYVKGGHEADRETCYRAGKRDVIEHIVKMINRANGVNDELQENISIDE